jgi:hypothetical protein
MNKGGIFIVAFLSIWTSSEEQVMFPHILHGSREVAAIAGA